MSAPDLRVIDRDSVRAGARACQVRSAAMSGLTPGAWGRV